MIVLGMMSGTSLDGVDCVWIKAEGNSNVSMKLLKHKYIPYPTALRRQLLKATIGKATSHEVRTSPCSWPFLRESGDKFLF